MNVNVITASRHGSTTEIGGAIAARLRELGHDARTADAASLSEVPPADAAAEPEVERFGRERARGRRLLAGRLDRSSLGRLERLAVKAVDAPDGDYRDWIAIAAWADEISDELVAAEAPAVGAAARVC